MYLEALITICLYYMRSYFSKGNISTAEKVPSSVHAPTAEDIRENGKVQLASVELLTAICTEMVAIAKEMGKGFVCYIADLIAKCKVQKIVLHSVLTSVYSFGGRDDVTLTDEVLRFNDPGDDRLHYESLQIVLLKLLQSVIRLEFEVSGAGDFTTNSSGSASSANEHSAGSHSPTRAAPNTPTNIKYLNNCNICQQPMFLSAILNALQADHLRHLHKNWTDLVVASLGCFVGGSLTNIVISVVHQICNNLDKITMLRAIKETKLPPDYTLTQVEALTVLVHYCLLDSTQQMTLSHVFNQAFQSGSGPNSAAAAALSSVSTNQLLNNLVHVFLSTPLMQGPSGAGGEQDKSRSALAMHMAARNAMLSHLPRIVASVAALWDNEIGQGRLVNKQLLELLSPVSLHHNVNFLAAIAVVWQERGDLYRRQQQHQVVGMNEMAVEENVNGSSSSSGGGSGGKSNYRLLKPLPQACTEQLSLVKLISGIRIMPMDSFVQTLQQVVKQPPAMHHPPPGLSLDVSALELFYFYMQSVAESQLNDAWPSLLALLRDGLTLSAPGQFVLLAILSDFVQRSPQMPFVDKRDLRDLHDITSKLVESISAIGASCLEQTTWLRRNLAVKEEQHGVEGQGGTVQVGGRGAIKDAVLVGNQQFAVQAQSVLAALLANLLDITYGSQEKDKVVTLMTTLMYNITPYLKNHTVRNIPSFLACSSLLASLSMYQVGECI